MSTSEQLVQQALQARREHRLADAERDLVEAVAQMSQRRDANRSRAGTHRPRTD